MPNSGLIVRRAKSAMARCYQINILIVGIIGQALISTANGRVTGGCFIEPFAKIRIADRVRLQVKHAGNHLQTILDAVVDLLPASLDEIHAHYAGTGLAIRC